MIQLERTKNTFNCKIKKPISEVPNRHKLFCQITAKWQRLAEHEQCIHDRRVLQNQGIQNTWHSTHFITTGGLFYHLPATPSSSRIQPGRPRRLACPSSRWVSLHTRDTSSPSASSSRLKLSEGRRPLLPRPLSSGFLVEVEVGVGVEGSPRQQLSTLLGRLRSGSPSTGWLSQCLPSVSCYRD